jgi:hypothetical protein
MSYDMIKEHFENIKEFLATPEALACFPKPKKIANNDWAQIEKEIVDMGFSYFPTYYKKTGTKYPQVVPTPTVLALGELYKSKFGTNGNIDWWIEEKERQRELFEEMQ